MHPERVAEDESAVRWLMPAGTLDFVGEASAVPGQVQELLDDGTLAGLTVEPTAIRTRIGGGRSWASDGARVRAALQQSLGATDQWVAMHPDITGDDVLRMAAEQVIAGQVGDYIRSHGGAVEILDVSDGHVEVQLMGSCQHCPAAELTMTTRFETALRALFPDLRSVRARNDARTAERSLWQALMPVRRS